MERITHPTHSPQATEQDAALQAGGSVPDPLVIPVVEERPVIGKRRRETGRVRIAKKVSTRQETLETSGWLETIRVERIAKGLPLDGPVPARQEGDTLVIPVMEEKLVVEKRLFLKEELRITKVRAGRGGALKIDLRREEVSVERVPPRVDVDDDGF